MVMFVPVANEITSPNEPVARLGCRVSGFRGIQYSSVLSCTVAVEPNAFFGEEAEESMSLPHPIAYCSLQNLVFD